MFNFAKKFSLSGYLAHVLPEQHSAMPTPMPQGLGGVHHASVHYVSFVMYMEQHANVRCIRAQVASRMLPSSSNFVVPFGC